MEKIKYHLIIIGFIFITFIFYYFSFTHIDYAYDDFDIKEMVSKAEYDWYAKRYMNHKKNYGYTLIYYDKDNKEQKVWFEQDDWWTNYDVKNLKLRFKYKYRIHLSLFEFPFEKNIKLIDTEKYIYRSQKSSN